MLLFIKLSTNWQISYPLTVSELNLVFNLLIIIPNVDLCRGGKQIDEWPAVTTSCNILFPYLKVNLQQLEYYILFFSY